MTPRSCVCRISIAWPATSTRVPASGISPSCSTMRPLSVFGPVQREMRAELAVERAQRRHAVDDDAAVGVARATISRAAGRLRREVADDLLDDVLDRHEALELAVLVDDEAEPLAVGLELLQLGEQRRAGRARSTPGAGSTRSASASIVARRAAAARPASGGRCRRCCRARPRRRAAACGRRSRAARASSAGLASRSSAWIWLRGVITSSTVIALDVEQVGEHRAVLAAEILALEHERAQLLLRQRRAGVARPAGCAAACSSALHEQVDEPDDRRRRLEHRRERRSSRPARCGRRAPRRRPSA